jgi:hypothetical protein
VPAADVFVDDERVGKTPLEMTVAVAPGIHRIEVRRAGYVPLTRTLALQGGSRSDLVMNPVVDSSALDEQGGFLAIHASETQAVASVDGEDIGLVAGSIHTPAGPHRIRVERGGFLSAERDIDVPLGATANVSVVFEPTPDTRAQYVVATERRRLWSWMTIGAGAAIAAAGAIVGLVEQKNVANARANAASVSADFARMSGRPCDYSMQLTDSQYAGCKARLDDAYGQVNTAEALRTTGWIAAGVGSAVLALGVGLLVTSDDPHKYDEKPAQRLLAGWRLTPAVDTNAVAMSALRAF